MRPRGCDRPAGRRAALRRVGWVRVGRESSATGCRVIRHFRCAWPRRAPRAVWADGRMGFRRAVVAWDGWPRVGLVSSRCVSRRAAERETMGDEPCVSSRTTCGWICDGARKLARWSRECQPKTSAILRDSADLAPWRRARPARVGRGSGFDRRRDARLSCRRVQSAREVPRRVRSRRSRPSARASIIAGPSQTLHS